MGKERLSSLALMHVHSDFDINIKEVVDTFNNANQRKGKCYNPNRYLGCKLQTYMYKNITFIYHQIKDCFVFRMLTYTCNEMIQFSI